MDTGCSLAEDLRVVEVVFTSVSERLLLRNPAEEEVESLLAAAAAASSSILQIAEFISAGSLKEETEKLNLQESSFGRIEHTEPAADSHGFREVTDQIQNFREEAACGDVIAAPTREDLSEAIPKNESYRVLAQDLKTRGNALFAEEIRKRELTAAELEDYHRIWIECCETLCKATFHEKIGAQVTAQLSRTAPGQCASWLECLKKVAAAIHLARDCNVRAGNASKKLVLSLRYMWPELKNTGGLLSNRWRTRLAAVNLAAVLHEVESSDAMEDRNVWLLEIYKELLDQLVSTLALSDSHWLVRRSAVQCASQILKGFGRHLPVAESDCYMWGFLAASLDKHSEVQKAVVEIVLHDHLVPGSHYCEETISHLIDKFVGTASLSIRHLQKQTKNTKSAEVKVFEDLPDITLLLIAIDGAIHLQLLDQSTLNQAELESGYSQSSVPLLVASAASLLKECEISKNRSRIMEVSKLLRSFMNFQYGGHVIAMISSRGPSYTGASIAKFYRASSVIDDDTADLFKELEAVIILKGVSVALEGLWCGNDMQASQQGDLYLGGIEVAKIKFDALQHIVEMVEIPSNLVQTTKDIHDNDEAAKFLHSCYYLLKIADAILKHHPWLHEFNAYESDLVQRLVLSCAAFASAEGDAGASLSWITKDIQELAFGIVDHVADTFCEKNLDESFPHEPGGVQRLNMKACNDIERLLAQLLPILLLKFKSQLKDNLSTDRDGNFTEFSSSASLPSAIIAAHQMYWCLKQVKHPHLGPFCTLLMPCVLMALDHYSPHVKRQAIKVFIHLADNLNPSELRWYKDATLDCITRSITGCGELWPLVVVMSVQLVTCIEGKNPRARWFGSILDAMLGELERHQNDAERCTVWLQNIANVFEAMGLILVAHFKRLLPLLFLWLHTQDDTIRILVLQAFRTIVRHTWPRMPFHAERFWRELAITYKESWDRTFGPDIRAAVTEVCLLLKLCAGTGFEAARQKGGGDSMEDSLDYALDHLPEPQGA